MKSSSSSKPFYKRGIWFYIGSQNIWRVQIDRQDSQVLGFTMTLRFKPTQVAINLHTFALQYYTSISNSHPEVFCLLQLFPPFLCQSISIDSPGKNPGNHPSFLSHLLSVTKICSRSFRSIFSSPFLLPYSCIRSSLCAALVKFLQLSNRSPSFYFLPCFNPFATLTITESFQNRNCVSLLYLLFIFSLPLIGWILRSQAVPVYCDLAFALFSHFIFHLSQLQPSLNFVVPPMPLLALTLALHCSWKCPPSSTLCLAKIISPF